MQQIIEEFIGNMAIVILTIMQAYNIIRNKIKNRKTLEEKTTLKEKKLKQKGIKYLNKAELIKQRIKEIKEKEET